MSHASALVNEVANELGTWPGVRVQPRPGELMLVTYESVELGVLDRARGVAELRFPSPERDRLVEDGSALPVEPTYGSEDTAYDVRGPSDVTAVLELFDRRYRDVRGEADPYSSSDAG